MTSIGSIVGGAFGSVLRRPLAVLVWGLVYIAVTVGFALVMRPMLTAQSAMMAGGPRPDPQLLAANMQMVMGPLLLAEILFFVVVVVLFAAAMRAVLRPEAPGFAYLRLGMDELRLLGLGIVLAVGFYIAFLIVFLLLALVVGLIAGISHSVGVAVVLGVAAFVALFGATFFLQVRLSLSFPLTLLRGRIIVGEAWRLSQGRFWTLFGGYLVVWLVNMVLFGLVAAFTFGPYLSELAQGGLSPQAVREAMQHQMARAQVIDAMVILGWVLSGLVGGFGIATFGGAVATAARDLAGGPEDDVETFA